MSRGNNMFDIKVIELIKEEKRRELEEKKSGNNRFFNGKLESEIKYLEHVEVRYKIAELLGLESNKKYIDTNFLGVENENVDKYNLSAEQRQRYDKLVAQIGSKPKVIANLVDVAIGFNINKEAERLFEKLFNALNVDDSNRYNAIKDDYLDKIDVLLKVISEDAKNALLLSISNYDLACELAIRHPGISVKMNMFGVGEAIAAMNLSKVAPEKYDKCLEIICSSINGLYMENANKAAIEGFLNGIGRTNYILRNDLATNLTNIENVQLGIKNSEYGLLVKYINQNYDTLDENSKEKYYSLLKAIVNKNIGDSDKMEELNTLLKKLTNKDVSRRLQRDFASNKYLRFNVHLSSYDALIQDTINKLELKKREYQRKSDNAGKGFFSAYYETKIKDIEKEIAKLKAYNADYDDSSKLKKLDALYNVKATSILDLETKIKELKDIRESLISNFQKKKIDRTIIKIEKRIGKLRQSQVKIVGKQKRIMLPKVFLERIRGRFSTHFESKAEVFSTFAEDYRVLADAERKVGGFFGGINAMFYDLQANKYERKSAFNSHMCEVLRSGSVMVDGSNRYLVPASKLHQAKNSPATPSMAV